ncbi:MAG TPA: TIGR02302 family protein, partial [Afifellaceae bacterium]|nr:TIGR02302 family protein [Afifellaceae bacterium]
MADRRDDSEQRLRRLAGAVRRARLALLWERAWPRLVPLLTLAGLFVAVSWLGLWRVTPDALRIGLLAAFAIAGLAALVPLVRLALPREADGLKRVERVSALDHRPASGLRDRLSPVADDDAAKALWAAHRLRLLAAIGSLKAGAPRPDLIRRDPHALRFAVPLVLVVALAVASGEHLLRLQEAFTPVGRTEAAAPMRIDAWIDPPPYTGQPPVFLSRRDGRGDAVAVPESSRLTVRVVSDEPPEVAVETPAGSEALDPEEDQAAASAAAAPGGAIRSYRAELGQDGAVVIRNGGEETRYVFSIIEDRPPTISRGPVTVNRAGSFTMEFQVADDYGVTGGSVTFRPKGQVGGARPLVDAPQVPLRLPRSARREGTARADARIGDHPFAGLEVDAEAVATDAAGQEGRPTEDGTMELPARPFRNPIARALVEQRQILAQDARAQGRVAMAIEAMTLWPERFIDDSGIYLGLVVAHRRVVTAQSDDELRDMLDYLWTMARTIEDGILSDAEERLNAAREALEQALADGAPEEEIARLTEELRQALNEYMQSMMEEMARRGGELPEMPMSPDMQTLSQRDLDRMLDRIEELARMGDMESAQALLNQLQQMLDNLQMAQRGQMGEGDQGEMMRMMEEIARMMREQQQLMDDTFN